MPDQQYGNLLELVRGRAGDAFRAAVKYDPTGWTMLYVREDVATDELRTALDTLTERARDADPVVTEDVYDAIGDTQATVELHAAAALIHFRETDSAGVVVSLDREIAQGLGHFVTRCTDVLNGS